MLDDSMRFDLLFLTVKTAALYLVPIRSYSAIKDCAVTFGPLSEYIGFQKVDLSI